MVIDTNIIIQQNVHVYLKRCIKSAMNISSFFIILFGWKEMEGRQDFLNLFIWLILREGKGNGGSKIPSNLILAFLQYWGDLEKREINNLNILISLNKLT